MDKITLTSPAKINIGLNVIGKRDDGFHNLETIFYPLLLSDKIIFQKADKTIFKSNSDEIENLDSNLILDAVALLNEKAKKNINVQIFLEKNIPIGAGLGGGSSNAAVTLKALNQLFNLKFNYNVLSEIALELGSDVPYFLNPVPCFASSRGEYLTSINLSLSYPILIVNPGINISTKWAFDRLGIKQYERKLSKLIKMESITLEDIKISASNDFEEIVFKEYPEIKSIKEELYTFGAEISLMTGTGSSVFGIFSNLQKARRAQDEFENNYFTFLNFPLDRGSIT